MVDPGPIEVSHDAGKAQSAAVIASIACAGVCFAAVFALPSASAWFDNLGITRWLGAVQLVLLCVLLIVVVRLRVMSKKPGVVAAVGAGIAVAAGVALFGPMARDLVSQGLSLSGVLIVVGILVGSPSRQGTGRQRRQILNGHSSVYSGSYDEPSGALRALHSAAVLRDGDTQHHGQAVAKLAARLGATLGMPPIELRALYWAALLHDVGKVGVERSVLRKPDKLSQDEYHKVMRHPSIGADLIRSVGPDPLFREIALMVLHHHERWDGRGYPSGRRSTEIPIGARIIAITDVFEALLSDRAYRPAMSYDEALKIIIDGSGYHFDPDIVSVFLRMMSEQARATAPVDAVNQVAVSQQGVGTSSDVTQVPLRPRHATLTGLG